MAARRPYRPLLAVVTASATIASYVGIAAVPQAAHAVQPDTQAFIELIDDVQAFVPGLAGVGRLAQALPTLDVAPGSPAGIGLADLLSQARFAVLGGPTFDGADTVADLVDEIDGANGTIAGDRDVSFTAAHSAVGTVQTIQLGVHATREIASASLDVGDDDPSFSLASAGGVELDLTLDATFALNYDSATGTAWVTRSGTSPSLSVGAAATIPTPSAVEAGLGILGIRLDTGTTFALDASVTTSWSDPNNDGRLAFDEAGGTPDDGELSTPGAGAGLVTAGLASGSLDSTLKIVGRPSATIDLGDANVTVDVDAPDLTTGLPQVTVTAGDLADVEAFLTMSTRDLAQGLAQAVSAVLALQSSTGVDLPFMRGGLADAIPAVEAIQQFLAHHVPPPAPGSATPGLPDFPSLQDLFEDLEAETGLPGDAAMNVLGAAYDAATKKVNFTLQVTRAASGTPQDLNPVGSPLTGTATYTATKLVDSDPGKTFSADLVGRQVVAGGSTGVVKTISGNEITLDPAPLGNPTPDVRWQGGTPANGTAYSISASDPKTGLVELADTLKDLGAIRNANAKVAQADVTPSYTLTLPLALDLRPADESDCDPDPVATAACPFEDADPISGITRIVTSLPMAADRILLRTGTTGTTNLLTADAPITTAVDVDAVVGFVKVKLTGTLKECTTNTAADCTGTTASSDHLLTLDLKSLAGSGADPAGDIPITTFFTKLAQATAGNTLGTLFDFDIDGQAYASLTLSVPGGPDFFGGATPSVQVTLPDITNLGGVSVTGPELAKLKSLDVIPDNPLALFGAILSTLQALQGTIDALPGGSAGLDTTIPLVGRSFRDVIGSGASGGPGTTYEPGTDPATTALTDASRSFDASYIGRRVRIGTEEVQVVDASGSTLTVKPALDATLPDGTEYEVDSELQGLINILNQQPTESLQDLLDVLAAKLGNSSTATFAVENGTPNVLKLAIDWKRLYETQAPVNLSFDLGGSQSLVGAEGTGVIDITATGQVKLTLRLPLTSAAVLDPISNLTVDPAGSFVKAGVSVNGDGVKLAANLGPFEASLGNPVGDAGTQLRAGLGVSLANGGGSPVSLSSFASGLALTVNGDGNGDGTADGAACSNAPVASGTDLALCAYFPAYLNGAKVNADDALNAFIVRLPVGTNLADTFDVAGPNVGGQPRFVHPTGLETALANAALNLLPFGDGFLGYLEFLEKALEIASFDGKLPVIGKDLQAGSEFLGTLRAQIEGVFAGAGVPTNPTAQDIRDFLNDEVKPELPGASGFAIDVTCNIRLQAAAAPNVTPATNGDPTPSSYRYKIVAYTNSPIEDTVPSDPSASVANAATLDGTHFNSVSWSAVTYATGYKVLRSKDGGAYQLLKDVGNVTSYQDKGADAPSAYTAETEEPLVVPCPGDASGSEITGFSVTVDIGQGNPTTANGCTNAECLNADMPVDLGLPGLSIKAEEGENLTGKLGWHLHLKLGLDRENGFYVQTQDTNAPEFIVGASLDVPDFDARLAFIKVAADSNTADPEFKGAFSIDLRDDTTAASDCIAGCSVDNDARLTLDKLKNQSIADFVKPVLQAEVDVDWHLQATADAALPGIAADFLLHWAWASNTDPANAAGLDKLEFNNVTIDPGTFLNGSIGPIVKQIVDVFKPVQPILDTIQAPLPVLSDLSRAVGGDDITIASLAQAFSTLAGGPDIEPFLQVLSNVRDLVKALSGDCGGPAFCVNVGSFKLVTSKALTTDANPATADSLVNKTDGFAPNNGLLSDLDGKTPGNLSDTSGGTGPQGDPHPGFTFPALQEPSKLFGLLLGQDVELARFDSGPLSLGFEFQKSFGPVYAPPPVNVVIGGGASVTLRVVAGFDTYGIRTAFESGKVDAKILDSLYFVTTENGKPIPVVEFEGFLQAGASVSAVVIEVGIVGGIKLTVGFFWNDPNNDGKFRFSEFLTAALRNPICLFNVGGELSLFIKVFITLGVDPFSVSFDFTLIDVVLLDFSLKPNCEPPPPRLGGTKDGVLYLFAGKLGNGGERGDSFWNNGNAAEESWIIRQVPFKADPDGTGPKKEQKAKIVVQALGISEEFDDTGDAIHTVVFDGRGYAGPLQVTFNGGDKGQAFTKKTVVATGSGKDIIRTGEGESWVDSGGDEDTVTTLDRQDLSKALPQPAATVAGGAAKDTITVGNAADTVLGDGGLGFTSQGAISVASADDPDTTANESASVSVSGAIDPGSITVPSPAAEAAGDGPDTISAGLGGATIYGNGGADTIGTANDNPQAELAGIEGTTNEALYRARKTTVVGGSGSDRIRSGSAGDEIYTGAKVVIDGAGFGSGDAAADENTVDTGTGSDTVYGSNAKDFVTTHSLAAQTATVFGGDANDVVIGGHGTDKLYGGPGDDYLVAQPSTVSSDFPVTDVLGTARRVTPLSADPITVAKTLVGGGGRDRIYGADGPATIYGDQETDGCVRQSGPVSKQPPENPVVAGPASGLDADDLILGGEGIDTVQAGGGNDHVFLFGSNDVACGNAGIDEVFGGAQDDLVYGGSGADKLYGDANDDELYANTGDDAAYGGTGEDRIQGNDGADILTGDSGTDLVIGGTSKAGEPDTGDRLYGDTGTDTLVGDNADSDVIPAYPLDLDGLTATAGGADTVWGGDQDDRAYGGLANDLVYGGLAADYLEGNTATDTVYGEAGPDDVIGGSSEEASSGVGRPDANDILSGGAEDDVITGDNAQVDKVVSGSALTKGRSLTSERSIALLDLGFGAAAGLFGGDTIDGDAGTDVILGQRGDDTIRGGDGADYAEGGPNADTIDGDAGQDDLLGGSYTVHAGSGQGRVGQPDAGDTIRGGDDADVALGDNGALLRDPAEPVSDLTQSRGMTERAVAPYDLGDAPTAGTSGADLVHGNGAVDVILGQSGDDRLLGDDASDYAEGGPGTDWIEGNAGSDDLVGGSSTILGTDTGLTAIGQPDAADVIWGQGDDDLATGDNARITRNEPYHSLTYRIGSSGLITERRSLRLLDLSSAPNGELSAPDATRFGGDYLSGQAGVDVLLGQDGPDSITGGSADDYAEGQGGDDRIFGDQSLASVPIALPVVAWPGVPSAGYDADGGADGQDDLLGGSSRPAFRDGADVVHGNGASDFVLGDNGTSVREVLDESGVLSDRIYAVRYPVPAPAGAAKVRESDPAYPSTRFCTTTQPNCEPAGAFGGDSLFGEGGDDFIYGQDGDDTAWGGDHDDDMYGELGDDRLFGEAGDDAILGDRGGVRDVLEDGSASETTAINAPPAITYTSRRAGSVSRVVDLFHDVNGDVFVGSGAGAKMPYDGIGFGGTDALGGTGGDDRIRGGLGRDSIHGGFGDDLANGDSGGDTVYGGDGADVLWGGKGCDAAVDTVATSPDCFTGGVTFDPAARGTDDRFVDYVFGGKGATTGPSVLPTGSLGSDVLDWRVRGGYDGGAGCTTNPWPTTFGSVVKDPCSWFEMTDVTDADDTNNQHHQGIDWQYGGWDRDVLQADVADNGPNPGDRLLDWNGAYNLYTHCNAAYGGFNDVRQLSPDHIALINKWSYGVGAGQVASDVTTAGTSAFIETAIVYQADLKEHGSGKAYPSTPGHFDQPNACAP